MAKLLQFVKGNPLKNIGDGTRLTRLFKYNKQILEELNLLSEKLSFWMNEFQQCDAPLIIISMRSSFANQVRVGIKI